MSSGADIAMRLHQLRIEHRDLDHAIRLMAEQPGCDRLQLQRMKRRKLMLKDQISWLERELDPDVPA